MDHQIIHHNEASEPSHEGLSTFQDQTLAILPIPSAMLSVLGSSVIIYMAFSTRRQRKWSTYTRLLIGLSICDIISSVSLGLAAFMRRPQSGRAFALGNDATCTAEGTLLQFAHSNLFYNMFLSFYFLATVRLGVKHTVIAKRYEPIMHFVALGYPLVTAIIGAVYGMYKETATGMGCWVNEYPTGCGDLPGQVKCKSGFIGWMFSGLPYLLALLSIGINNLTIWFYVRKQRKPLMERSRRTTRTASSDLSEVDVEDSSIENKSLRDLPSIAKGAKQQQQQQEDADGVVNDPDDIMANSTKSKYASPSDLDCSERENRATKDQNRRLRLVSSQAFLFVLCYAICTIWGGLMGLAESSTGTEDEPELMKNIYGLMVANAIFAPLQGFLNMLVYMRPKYVKARHQFPRETIYWAFRRAVLGDRVRPEQRRPSPHPQKKEKGEPAGHTVTHSGGSPMVTEEHPTHPATTTPSSRPRETIGRDGIDHTHHMVPLPKSTMVSDLTASLGDFDADGRDEEEGMMKKKPQHESVRRTKGAFEASSSLPRFHFKSSLEHMKSLQAIIELTESVFDPIVTFSSESESSEDESIDSVDSNPLELSERRWCSSTGSNASPATASTGSSGGASGLANCDDPIVPLSMGLVPPRRMDSDFEILIDDNEPPFSSPSVASPMGLVPPRRMDSDFEILLEDEMKDEDEEIDDDMQDDIYEEEDLRDSYANLQAPKRPSSMNNKGSYNSVSSSISSSCSIISFSEEDLDFEDDDFDYSVHYNDEEEKTPDEKNGDDSRSSTASTTSSSVDTPIQAPRRKLSPTPPATAAVA